MEKQQFNCRACGQSFNSSDELERHNSQAHRSMGSGHEGTGSTKIGTGPSDYKSAGRRGPGDAMNDDEGDSRAS
jgi:hypothetical protein